MDTRIGLWARLTNAKGMIHLASGDWERILMRHGSLAPTDDERWSADSESWLWLADEALKLAAVLTAAGGRQCIGSLMVDIDLGEGIRGTGHEFVADGLTPEQRTAKLIRFLQEGSFKWRFITGPNQVVTGGRSA